MISIIICSKNSDLLGQVSESVEKTIGVTYEIIAIDNSEGIYGICQAYNMGASKAKYEYLCFMHEDIKFHSFGWGHKVSEILNNHEIGLLGVAGATIKSKAPSGWWSTNDLLYIRINILQSSSPGSAPRGYYTNPTDEKLSAVVSLDGVWLCTKKQIWEKNKFDSHTFKEFHFYDMDFCMQVIQNYKVCVTYDILIEHYSHGSTNASWAYNAITFSQKWKHKLPLSLEPISKKQMQLLEYGNNQSFLKMITDFKFQDKYIFKYTLKGMYLHPDNKKSLRIMKNIIKSKIPTTYIVFKTVLRKMLA
jgi:glycosyltransferase involved in cell wall biosynthesis